jgi:hypothetical protein
MPPIDPRFPASIHQLWEALRYEVVWLHGRWIMYRQLFGTSPERIAILNRSAGTFFNTLESVLMKDVQISLSKLGDPADSKRGSNMTLKALLRQLERHGETLVASKLDPLIAVFDASCQKIRHRRNKWIAHFDMATMLNRSVTPLEGPSRAEIEEALLGLREAMNCVEVHYADTSTAYEYFTIAADGDSLISTLMRGLRYEEMVQAREIPQDNLRKNFKAVV